MTVRVLIPVKRFAASKSRLAGLFDAGQRVRLAEAMLRDTLAAVRRAKGLNGIALVTADPAAAAIGKAEGALVLDDDAPDLNGALASGREQLFSMAGPSALLVLPVDLPALAGQDVETVIRAGQVPESVVIVRDHNGDGTNALLLGRDVDLGFAYGPDSFRRHLAAAGAAGLEPTALTMPRMAWDFDNPADLPHILKWPVGRRIASLLSGVAPITDSVREPVS